MIPLYSTGQIRNFDSFAINSLGVPSIVLMENAAKNISNLILEKFPNIKSVGILCGRGNNGGDGFTVARHLSNAGLIVRCIHLGNDNEMTEDCRTNYNILRNLAKTRKNIFLKKFNSINDVNGLKKTDLVIDAMLGSGFSGELKEPILSIVKKVNSFPNKKVAIDVPTGLNSDTGYGSVVFNSDLTITLGELKKGLLFSNGYEFCGDVFLEEIGVGRDYFDRLKTNSFLIEPEDVLSFLPTRSKTLNKYSAGKVLNISGSYDYPGAAILSSASAFISGAGAVILTVPDLVKKYIYKNLPEIVIQVYGDKNSKFLKTEDYKTIREKIRWADVVALGCGLGREEETIKFVNLLLTRQEFKFCVIDADAIFAIKENLDKLNLSDCVLTPHLGEFSHLISIPIEEMKKDLLNYGIGFSKKYKTTLVLKGAPTIVFHKGEKVIINSSGNNGLAKFGSGDALTGMLAGFIAQSKKILEPTLAAVYIHGLAADLIRDKKTEFSILSSEIIKYIPTAISYLRSSISE